MKYIVKLFGMICMYLRDKSTNNLCSSSSANSVNFLLLLTNKVAFCWFNLTEQEPRIFNSLSAISDSMNSLVSSGKTSKAFLKLDTKLESFFFAKSQIQIRGYKILPCMFRIILN